MYGSGLIYPEHSLLYAQLLSVLALALTWYLIRRRRPKPIRRDKKKVETYEEMQKRIRAREAREAWNDMQRCRLAPHQRQTLSEFWEKVALVETKGRY